MMDFDSLVEAYLALEEKILPEDFYNQSGMNLDFDMVRVLIRTLYDVSNLSDNEKNTIIKLREEQSYENQS